MQKRGSLAVKGRFDKRKSTERQWFLAEIEQVTSWATFCTSIEAHYPKARPAGGQRPLPPDRIIYQSTT